MIIDSQHIYFGVTIKKNEFKTNDDGTYTFTCEAPESIREQATSGMCHITSVYPYDISIGALSFINAIKGIRYDSGKLIVTSDAMPDMDELAIVFGIEFVKDPEPSMSNTT
ncbi:hypothetical protein [uncultured Duncaniella sp.]|uniref:hypothetical protein n=1 Tax=uncultured Duncaniella sp. TaxID=2768039 RepID=UPI002633FAD8|nr:hypothetical protein [uncultured Duncaniella sp.]